MAALATPGSRVRIPRNACSDEMCVCLQDLVKSHLMLAVREEVEVLREQIKELSERNAELERENYILRALYISIASLYNVY
uniref:Uncharacterized protein n=1 Tax=Sinocyclocheilus anshuiensis TaxID=1608454 RepID=A0A671M3T9_9TELE